MIKPALSSVSARVRLELDVPAGSSWGSDCNLEQVFRQAGEETADGVVNALHKAGIKAVIVSKQVTAMSSVSEKWR